MDSSDMQLTKRQATGKDEKIALNIENIHRRYHQGNDVIVSLVAPYVDQREDFKALMGDQIIEFYVHTTESRERDHFKAIAYTPPLTNFVDIDTTHDTEKESFEKVLGAI